MPTIHFEYTENLKITHKIKPFLLDIHHFLVDTIKTDILTCRSLILPYNNYVIANGDDSNAFVQLTVKILPGRPEELKQQVGKLLLEKLKTTFAHEIDQLQTELRVYIQETDINHYHGLM